MSDQLVSLVQWAGLIGFLASVSVGVADAVMIGSGEKRRSFSFFAVMANISQRRIHIGTIAGILIPVSALGFLNVLANLWPAGVWFALPPILLFLLFDTAGAGFHVLIGVIGTLYRHKKIHADDANIMAVLNDLEKTYVGFVSGMGKIIFPGMIIASIWFSVIVGLGMTAFSPWAALWSPAAVLLIARECHRFLPSTIAGYIAPANVHIAFAPLFLISMATLNARVS